MIDVWIPGTPPSLNVLLRQHWTTRSRAAKEWRKIVACACLFSGVSREPAPAGVQVWLEFHRATRRRFDCDNRVKLVLDGLVEFGVLKDDSAPYVGSLTLTWAHHSAWEGVRVRIQ